MDDRAYYKVPRRDSMLHYHLPQVALFLDLGGTDTYLRRSPSDKKGDSKKSVLKDQDDEQAGNNRMWHVRAKDAAAEGGLNCCVAVDGEHDPKRLRFLRSWPRRVGK